MNYEFNSIVLYFKDQGHGVGKRHTFDLNPALPPVDPAVLKDRPEEERQRKHRCCTGARRLRFPAPEPGH